MFSAIRSLRRALAPRREATSAIFALRLAVAFVCTLALLGVVASFSIEHALRDSQAHRNAASVRADARTFSLYGDKAPSRALAVSWIGEALDAISREPGTSQTLLVGPGGLIAASGHQALHTRLRTDPAVLRVIARGTSYTGHLDAADGDTADIQFVAPVTLRGTRYALEVVYDHRALDGELAAIRRGLALVGLFALIGGMILFYLVGGRSLLRSHRLALHLATRDGLTALPNQRAFHEDLPASLGAATRNGESVALVALDVDDFKFLNDRHGHPFGDDVLGRVAAALSRGRASDRAYRIGGDEFAVVLPHTDEEGARVVARRLVRALAATGVKASIGVGVARHGSAEDLRAEADAALYEAKRRGGGQATHYQDIRADVAVTGADKRTAVRRLLDEGELTTVYQPIWNLADDTLLGIEALTRPDPAYGLDGPAEAFDIAEQLDRVHDLDVMCVANALASAPELPPGALLFLNVCPTTIDLDANGNDWLLEAARRAEIPPERIVIEVTERSGARTTSLIKSLGRIRQQGFKLALDDVGSGNSGLATLREVTVEFVKIDRAIVLAAPTEPGARGILMAMATYARQTGAFVIAEGIEDAEVLAFLRRIGQHDLQQNAIIQGGQGYGLGRPAAGAPAVARALPEAA